MLDGEQFDTIVIGAGQAGLSVSYHLAQRERRHVVLEQGRVGETWRTQRWDGFYLNTPNFGQQLPGHGYRGADPEAFSPLADVVAYLDEYAAMIGEPIRTGVRVSAVRPEGDGWCVETDAGRLRAANVVVATGAFQHPHVPATAAQTSPAVLQLHASGYRRPEQLPPGAVLVVGSGQSGCQIADELLVAGRDVYLAVGRCGWLPRRYRGRELLRWLLEIGMADDTVDALPSPAARLACNPAVSGNDGGHDCHPRWLARRRAILTGRVDRIDGARVTFAPDLEESLAKGDEVAATFKARVDEHVRAAGLDIPEEPTDVERTAFDAIRELDLEAAGVGTIVWATGYRPDFSWIEAPSFDEQGWPVQRRGVGDAEGVYFVGLHWLHKRKSALLVGVGEDAAHVASQIASTSHSVGRSVHRKRREDRGDLRDHAPSGVGDPRRPRPSG